MRFRVAVAQIDSRLGDLESNLKTYFETIDRAKTGGADLLVFPELSLTGYYLRDMVSSVALRDESLPIRKLCEASEDISLVVGYVEESKDYQFYNTGAYLEGGKIVHKHRKVYLPTYGMFDERRYFAQGNRIRAFESRFGPMGILICEDVLHPSAPYILSQDGAHFLCFMSCGPGRGISDDGELDSARMWRNLNRTFSFLFSCYVIYANRVGYEDGLNFWGGSEVLDPEGEVEASAKELEHDLIFATLDTERIRLARSCTPLLREERLELTRRELERISKRKNE